MYKLNLKNFPFKWEKENLSVYTLDKQKSQVNNKKIFFYKEKINFNNIKNGEKMSNLILFKDILINIGICKSNEDICKNRFNFITLNSVCLFNKNDNSNSTNECHLENENSDAKFFWNFECKNLNLISDDKNKVKIINNSVQNNKNNNTENYMNDTIDKIEDNAFKKINQNFDGNNLFTFFNKKINHNRELVSNLINKEKVNLMEDKNVYLNFLKLNDKFDNKLNFYPELTKTENQINLDVNLDNNLIKFILLKFIKDNIFSYNSINNLNIDHDSMLKSLFLNNEKKEKNTINTYEINNSTKNSFLKKHKKNRNKNKTLTERKLIDQLEKLISFNINNSNSKIYEFFEKKFQNYLNVTEKSINIMNLKRDNLELKEIIFNSEEKPLLIKDNLFSNNSINENDYLNFDEKFIVLSEQLKRKKLDELNLKSLENSKKDAELSKNIEKRINEIKNVISKENLESNKTLNNLISNLVKKLENVDIFIQKKFNTFHQFINNQEIINNSTKEFLLKEEMKKRKPIKLCFNGFIIK